MPWAFNDSLICFATFVASFGIFEWKSDVASDWRRDTTMGDGRGDVGVGRGCGYFGGSTSIPIYLSNILGMNMDKRLVWGDGYIEGPWCS